ncbi:spermatogenesis-associated protein 2-like protein [Phaenicophaeus curvirostris]|uniref:spermatogenesis-associated protein 2-like protein n=1 Tax=Phaenicophaeus curvirostris TaxID=33595 RepID=UPI0037F09B47
MCAGSARRQERDEYRHEYRRCLERAFRRGRAGACADPAFTERLRGRLRAEPALLSALQDDGPALLARGLRGRPDPVPALRGLADAFRLLESAAANLYLCPWRREFGTVQTFSGAYVHLLRPVLPEADLVQIFSRLGYEQRDPHSLVLSQPPPGPELAAAACGFFACWLECEILAGMVLRLQPRRLPLEDLLEARRPAEDVDTCMKMLQHKAADNCDDSLDLYQELPASPRDPREEDTDPPALWRDPGSPWDAQDGPRRGWDCCRDGSLGQEPVPSTGNLNLDTSSSSSRLFLEQELGPAGSVLSTLAVGRSPEVLGEPLALPPAVPQEAPELPCYQLHSCLRQGALPSYCCTTCQQLHSGTCAAGHDCRSRHRGQELRSERQQRLWLQRTEVDMLLADNSSS